MVPSIPNRGSASMLFVYSRHAPECAHKDEIKYRRCRCPKWIDGYVDGKRTRQSANTRSWEQAEHKARLMEEASDPTKLSQPVVTTIAKAVEAFMADEQGRNLSKETTKQTKTLFEKQLLPWAKHRGLNRLRTLSSFNKTRVVLARNSKLPVNPQHDSLWNSERSVSPSESSL